MNKFIEIGIKAGVINTETKVGKSLTYEQAVQAQREREAKMTPREVAGRHVFGWRANPFTNWNRS